jgi:hypothetical protein
MVREKRITIGLAALALVLPFAGCGGSSSSPAPKPEENETLTQSPSPASPPTPTVEEQGWSKADLRKVAAIYAGVLNREEARCMAIGYSALYPSLKALESHHYASIDESLEEEGMIAESCGIPEGKL